MTDNNKNTQISFKEFLLHVPDWMRTLPLDCIDVNDPDNLDWLTQNLAAYLRYTVDGHPRPTVVPVPVPVAIPEPVLPTKPKPGDRLFPFYIENDKVIQFKSRVFVSDDYECGVVVLTYFDVVSTKRKDGRIYGNEIEEIWSNDKLISSSKQRVKYALNLHNDSINPFYYIKHFKHFHD